MKRQRKPNGTKGHTLHEGINRASFLAEATVDALCHVDICTKLLRVASRCLIDA
jgi:hypothetical protein